MTMSEEQVEGIARSAVAYFHAMTEVYSARYAIDRCGTRDESEIPMNLTARLNRAVKIAKTRRADFRRHVFNAEIL